jgi:two-component system, OmpR family, phosphate regulon sensor histidine kinase PhoR
LLRSPEFLKYQSVADFSHDVVIAGRDDKPQRPVRIAVRLHPYGEGRKLMLTRDITALEQAEAMRRDFVANVSHEIRTPLTVIAGFVETMQSLSLEPHETKRYLDLMAGHSQRMKNLVEDLLILSRLEGSPLPGDDQSVGLPSLWNQAQHEARSLSAVLFALPEQQLDFQFPTECDGLVLVGIPSEIQSAWSNLLSNAVRYTPAGGLVQAAARIDGRGCLCLSVKDSGPGIAPEHLSRLTERFYRVDSSRSRDSGGTGLGLSIVKHVMQRHGGELRIDSQLGHGSRFELVFPAARLRGLSDGALAA